MVNLRGPFLASIIAFALGTSGLVAGFGLPAAPDLFKLDLATALIDAKAGILMLPMTGNHITLHLQPNPIAEGAVWGEDGVPRGLITETVTFEGRTRGGHAARVTVTEVGVFAAIFEPDTLFVEPLWLSQPGAPVNLHRVVLASDTPATVHADPLQPPASQHPSNPNAGKDAAARTATFLLESDHEFTKRCQAAGATTVTPCWVQHQQTLLNVAEHLFQQAGIQFQISSQWACTTPTSCPYQGNPDPTVWLDAFRLRWENRTDEPAHQAAHLFFSEALPGALGLAYQATLATNWAYSMAQVWPLEASFDTPDYKTTAHEIGHVFDGVHEEADPIPPSLIPTGVTGWAHTIMWPGQLVSYEFSTGAYDPTHCNLCRVTSFANDRLT